MRRRRGWPRTSSTWPPRSPPGPRVRQRWPPHGRSDGHPRVPGQGAALGLRRARSQGRRRLQRRAGGVSGQRSRRHSLGREGADSFRGTRQSGWGEAVPDRRGRAPRSEEHTSELQSQFHLVCRLLLEKKKNTKNQHSIKKKKKNK